MKKIKLLVAIGMLMLLVAPQTAVKAAPVSLVQKQQLTEVLMGKFYEPVEDDLELIIRVYGEEVAPGYYNVTSAKRGAVPTTATGYAYEVLGVFYADVYVDTPNGTIHYQGPLD